MSPPDLSILLDSRKISRNKKEIHNLAKPIKRKTSILDNEQGATRKSWGGKTSVALVYPNLYSVGMSNLGIHILYREMNEREDVLCERFFLPDEKELTELRQSGKPIRSIESGRSLKEFDVVAFALSFEIDGFNILDILRLGGIEIWSNQRPADQPFVLLGGPCATFNPEPWASFIDGAVIGEGEEIVKELLDCWQPNLNRQEQIGNLKKIPGLYLPSLAIPTYDGENRYQGLTTLSGEPFTPIERRWVSDLAKYPGYTEIISPDSEFGHMFLIEVARGCGRHCRFCMAGYAFRRPRSRSVEEILAAIDEGKRRGAKQIGLVGAAVSDHPAIDLLVEAVDSAEMNLSVASLRADNVSEILLDKLSKSGQRTVTFAPEAGSEKLRRVINKGLDEEDLLRASRKAITAGMRHIRLYAMLGLPEEDETDIDELIRLARTIKQVMKEEKHLGKVILSVNPFIPKPFTPFENLPLADFKDVERKIRRLEKELPRSEGYEIKAESLKESWVQAILARGDRRLSEVIANCGERGYREFARQFKKSDLSASQYLYQAKEEWPVYPWSHIDIGVEVGYFKREAEKAHQGEQTLPCFEGCTRCGVCK